MKPPFLILSFLLPLIVGCSTTDKPCERGGDTSWEPKLTGHIRCEQKRLRDGEVVNDGSFKQWHRNGTLALEGRFESGKRAGVWVYYDESGVKRSESRYENGVLAPKSDPIQQSSP